MPTSGARATAKPYGPTAVTPTTARMRHSTMRTTPSVPITIAYARKRPDPEQMPRARWAGA